MKYLAWLACMLVVGGTACGGGSRAGGGDAAGGNGGGGGSADAGSDAPQDVGPSILRLQVLPPNTVHEVDIGAIKTIPLMVLANFEDGSMRDVTAESTFVVENATVGKMVGTSFETAPRASSGADATMVTAAWGGSDGQAQITVVAYRISGTMPDFFFLLPHLDPAGTQQKPLDFGTAAKKLDVFFAMDTTGSMDGEVTNLSNNISAIMTGIKVRIPDTWAGVGMYEDFPVPPYGNFFFGDGSWDPTCVKTKTADQPFILIQPITDDLTKQRDATRKLFGTEMGYTDKSHGCGGDWAESALEALYQIATGEGITIPGTMTNVPSHTGGRGGVEFRDKTLPVIVQVSDALFHTVGEPTRNICSNKTDYGGDTASVATVAHGRAVTTQKLNDLCAKYVGIDSNGATGCAPPGMESFPAAVEDMERMAVDTGSLIPTYAWTGPLGRPAGCSSSQCCTDIGGRGRAPTGPGGLCPAVARINWDGTGLDSSIITTINALARFTTFTVTAEKSGGTTGEKGEMLPPGKTTADFIAAVVPFDSKVPAGPPTVPKPTIDLPTSSFKSVTPGTTVTFTVKAFNDFLPPTPKPQFFRARIKVVSNQGCTDLDEREVLILVPPRGAATAGP